MRTDLRFRQTEIVIYIDFIYFNINLSAVLTLYRKLAFLSAFSCRRTFDISREFCSKYYIFSVKLYPDLWNRKKR